MKSPKYLYLFLTFLLVQTTAMYIIKQSNLAKVETLKKHELVKIQMQYNSIISTFENLANTVFDGYINKPEIIKSVKEQNREELYGLLQSHYKYLRSIDFKQIHFHTKDNKSFLRMHKPEKFGDDLTQFRYSVNYTNTYLKNIDGLEMGRVVPGFRFLYPLFDENNNHIGSVEASFGINAFTKTLKKLYDVKTNFILDKDLVKKEIFNSSSQYYEQSIESDDYLLVKNSIDNKILKNIDILKEAYNTKIKDQIKYDLSENKPFNINVKINGFQKIITFLPVKNIQNTHIGYFTIYQNNEELVSLNKELTNRYIIAFIIIMGFFFVLFREFRHKDSLKKDINIKTRKLQETTAQLEEQTVELEEMNESLEDRIALEIEKNAKQERDIFQQSKQAALGDMIGNIAHQWRQPLSAISTSASGMQLTYQIGALNDEDFMNFTSAIIDNSKYLSQTIDDFRDFIKSEKKIKRFDLSDCVEKCMAIVNSSINNHHLNIQTKYEDNIFIYNYDNELQQAIINIFNNAKDALKEKIQDSDDRVIFIETYQKDNNAIVSIKDTAGGIPEDIMEKIFEPYFTTKHQSQGTGLGLYMTHQIIIDSMKGKLDVENVSFEYENKQYSGAQFSIILKIN